MTYQKLPLAAAIFASLYPAAQGIAQERTTDRAAGARLEPVIVTATRRSQNLQNVGQSVSAISTEQIEKQALRNLPDVVGALPSVNMVSSTPSRNSIVMRGVTTGSAEYRTDSQVAVYLDDQPMTSISQQVDVRLIDIERVETLMGPQGTLFGSSAQTGTIRYITNKPDFGGYSGQGDVEIGTTKGGSESYDVSGHINIPVSDNFALRAVGFYSFEGGYVDNVLGLSYLHDVDNSDVVEEDWNEYRVVGGRLQGRWSVTENWEASLSLIEQSSDAWGAWETDPALGDNKISRFFDEYIDQDWYQASATVKGDLGFAELSMTASYFDRDIVYEWDNMTYDQWRSSEGPGVYYALYNADYEFGTIFNDQKQNRYAYEVRLTSQGDSRFQWLAGAFYEDVWDWWHYGSQIRTLTQTTEWAAAQYYACYYASQGYDIDCPLPDTTIQYSNKYDKSVRQKAVFGEMTYDLTDRWSATAGGRWFEFNRHEVDVYQVPLGLPAFRGNDTLGRNERFGKDDDFAMKLGSQFQFSDDVMAYLLYSEGFRLGGSNGTRAASTGVIPLDYKSDKLHNYEVGLKSQWFDDKLQLNLSVFHMVWDDIQINDSSGDPWWVRGTFNGTEAEQQGVEIAGTWYATDNLSFEYSAFLADPEFSKDLVYPTDGTVIPAGTTMPVSPRRKYWLAVDYAFPEFTSGNFWTRASYNYQSKVWDSITALTNDIDDVTPGIQKDYDLLLPSWSTTTFQFGFSSASEKWDVALIVRNVLDETGYTYLSSSDYSQSIANGGFRDDPRYRYLRSLQRPRSVYLNFTYKW